MNSILPDFQKPSNQLLALTALVAVGFLLWPSESCPPLPASYSITANTAYNLKDAIRAYHDEYMRYPLGPNHEEQCSSSNEQLMTILNGSMESQEEHENPRRIRFYSGKPAKRKSGAPHSGMTMKSSGRVGLWDPWGNPYRVRVDHDKNNQIKNPEPNPKTGSPIIPETIIVWSAGPDGNFSTWKDNIQTW